MRAIGFLLLFVFSPILTVVVTKEKTVRTSGQPKISSIPSFHIDQRYGDTASLKRSAWYSKAMKAIEASEYDITPIDQKSFTSPNRKQNLRANYEADRLVLAPRTSDNWSLKLLLTGIFADDKKLYAPTKDFTTTVQKNYLRFDHGEDFSVEYINSDKGVRQNFIITKKPVQQERILKVKLQAEDNWLIKKVHARELHFTKSNSIHANSELVYSDLKVWDANHQELQAFFTVDGNEISINVNTNNAIYPITVDPLSASPNNILDDGDQANANFGCSVSSAGDINGDGYSDVIIGAYSFDDGVVDEGKAFIYYGSSTGLSVTPADSPDDADQPGANFGISVSTAGDVNADGFSDVIIGAYSFNDGPNNNEGRAYIYLGSASGLSASPVSTPDDGDQPNIFFGGSVAGVGDVNADGFSDVLIGAQSYTDDFSNEGVAFLYYGNAGGVSGSPAAILNDANQANALFGFSVAGAGDVNADGYCDVIVGCRDYNGVFADEGAIFIYHGSSTGLSISPDAIREDADQVSALFGISVACAGDVNGDGYSDVIVGAMLYNDGANNDEGAAFIYYGSVSGISTTPAPILKDADQPNAQFGISVACAGDVNGDGFSDVIVGAWAYDDLLNTDEGKAFVYYGSVSGLSTTPVTTPDDANQSFAQFGIAVASAGDVNGDGYSDIIVGANAYDDAGNTDEGWSFVYHGSPAGINLTATSSKESDQGGANLGGTVAPAGDVNGDGYSDVIVGAPLFDITPGNDEGIVYIFHGSAAGLNTTAATTLAINQPTASFGAAVACAGDVNGDGYSDVIVGAYGFDGGLIDEGAAFIYHGSSSGINPVAATILEGNQISAAFGVSVSSAGDVNGDGFGDIIVGAWLYDDSEVDEGAAFVYLGFNTGVNTTPNQVLQCNQIAALMGISVASGDVNGDGFSDVIIGALAYDGLFLDEGAAFVYHGYGPGINPVAATTLLCSQEAAAMGISVASAGDINGDGFGDIIVGAYNYESHLAQNDEGAAFVYHGSPSGIFLAPILTLENNMAGSQFGISVSSAGDVNGDGYSDVMVGCHQYSNPEFWEGAVYIYQGSSAGISTTATDIIESNDSFSQLGLAANGAGDVNADGYSDIIAGAPAYSNPEVGEGAFYIYHGNSPGNNLRNNLRLYNVDLVTPIQQISMNNPNLFGVGLYAKSFIGRQNGKMVWGTVRNGNPFPGIPISNNTTITAQQSSWSDLGATGFELKNQVAKQTSTKATYVRARVKFDLITAITGQVYGPWRYPEGFMRGKRDVGSVALPVHFVSFNAVKSGNMSKLQWITTGEGPDIRYEVQHSTDNLNFQTLTTVAGQIRDINEYHWQHLLPAKGSNFYRIKAIESSHSSLTNTRYLYFDKSEQLTLYPNPSIARQWIWVESESIRQNEQINWQWINSGGQVVFESGQRATTSSKISIQVPSLPSGQYWLIINTTNNQAKTPVSIIR